jgi:septal ring factor EnvC (AmiA/AmiB activator)
MAAGAQAESAPAKERLSALYTEIESQNANLININKSMKEVELSLIKLNREHRELTREEERLKAELNKLFAAWSASNKKISQIESDISEIRDRSLERIRSLYISQNDQVKSHLISTGKYENISELLFLLSRIESFDRDLVVKLRSLIESQRVEEARYSRLMKEQQEVKAKVVVKAEEIKANLQKKADVKSKLLSRETEVESVLVKLRANALRLETVVASLTEADVEESVDSGARKLADEARARFNAKSIPFEGPGLGRKLIGKPVNGRVVRSFGKFHHEEFNDLLFNKGILYAAPVAAPIKAVAKGQVVFVGQMPGYGDMIILDHGSRTHTLYAKVKEPRVQSRQLVDKGEVIGLTQEPMGERGNFYFEIRRSGKPVNPVELLP